MLGTHYYIHTVVLHINTTACSRVIPAKVGQFVRRTKDTIIARNKVHGQKTKTGKFL